MSTLYNYFVFYWIINPNFTTTNLDNVVNKELIISDELTAIEVMPKAQ